MQRRLDAERLQREQEEYEEWLLAEAEAAQLRAQEELAALVAREEVSCVFVCVARLGCAHTYLGVVVCYSHDFWHVITSISHPRGLLK
jgi:hypothetical protein